MQASKIIPGRIYAVRRGDKLLRFRVTSVNTITRRFTKKRSPHDSTSEVVGRWDEADNKKETVLGANPFIGTVLDPNDVLGPYQDYVELVERKTKEEAEKKQAMAAKEKQVKADRLMLYQFVGMQPPERADGYNQPFRVDYSGVGVSGRGAALIAEKVRELLKAKEAA